jgi:hypothetical protein
VQRRADAGTEPVQFVLADMNTRINHDPLVAMAGTCAALATSPDAGPHFGGCRKAGKLLDAAGQSIRQSFESTPERAVGQHLGAVASLIANRAINGARDLAWNNCLLLRAMRDDPVARGLFLDTLAAPAALASRMPAGGGLTP